MYNLIKLLFTVVFLAFYCWVKAQDTIYFKNMDTVLAKVDTLSEYEVVYRVWNNLSGPVYRVSSVWLTKVVLEGGESVHFLDTPKPLKLSRNTIKTYDEYMYLHKKRLHRGFTSLGFSSFCITATALSVYGIMRGDPNYSILYYMAVFYTSLAFIPATIFGSILLNKSFNNLKHANALKNLSLAPNFYSVAHTNSFNGGISVAYRF